MKIKTIAVMPFLAMLSLQGLAQIPTQSIRWAYRSKGNSGFVFINNYERLQQLSAKKNVQFDVCGVKFPQRPMTIPAGAMCIFPVNVDGIRYATAQLIAHRDGKIYLEQIKGVPTEICINGKVLKNVKARGLAKPVYKNIYLVDSETAGKLFLSQDGNGGQNKSNVPVASTVEFQKLKEAGSPYQITMGVNKVAQEPQDSDFQQAAVYEITHLPQDREGILLNIDYRGDVARLYADGKLVADNFYNARPFLMGLWRLPKDCQKLELRILPLQQNMPVYFPREADTSKVGEEVKSIKIVKR